MAFELGENTKKEIREKTIWIIEEISLPSTEYYILPSLKTLDLLDQAVILKNPPKDLPKTCIFLIFVRYLSKLWVDFIEENRKKIKAIFYFMDDDLFDLRSWFGLPLRYVKKLFFRAYRWKNWLLKNGAIFLVSNDYLLKKYEKLSPLILPPYPIFDHQDSLCQSSSYEGSPLVIFYFGTSAHDSEKKWLYPVIKKVLKKRKDIVFELIADGKIYHLYANLERTILHSPMSWRDYKNFLISKKRQIGLSPLLDYNFNRARNYTKFFEITACCAVGIYSSKSVFDSVITNNKNGLLLSNEPEFWIESILNLIENTSLRSELFSNSLITIKKLRESAEIAYKESLGGFEWKKM